MGNQEIVIVTRGLYTVALLTVCIQFYLLQCLPSILAKLKKNMPKNGHRGCRWRRRGGIVGAQASDGVDGLEDTAAAAL